MTQPPPSPPPPFSLLPPQAVRVRARAATVATGAAARRKVVRSLPDIAALVAAAPDLGALRQAFERVLGSRTS